MTIDLLVNLIAAGIAFLLGVSSRGLYSRISKRRRAAADHRSRQQRHPRYSAGWLIEYYQRRGRGGDLYSTECGGTRLVAPFLHRASWCADGLAEDLLLVQQQPHEVSAAPVDRRVVERRGRYLAVVDDDGEPWDEMLACAAGVTETASGPQIRLVLARYFQYLSACGPIEDETYAAIAKPSRRTPLRDAVLPDVMRAADCARGAHAFGMQVATVFDTGGQCLVLIQRRSFAVSIYGGALAVVPVFGCQSLDLTERTPVSLFHNYLREVYEELYGGVEVQRRGTRVDAAEELAAMTINWEIQDIAIYDLWSSELSAAMLAGEFSPGSVFTLARTREVLAHRRPT